ncbi:TBC1 domain family member 24 [Schistosoma japonicum]|nr:TBC1 domain family member 24 [Schistosoma japonicum]
MTIFYCHLFFQRSYVECSVSLDYIIIKLIPEIPPNQGSTYFARRLLSTSSEACLLPYITFVFKSGFVSSRITTSFVLSPFTDLVESSSLEKGVYDGNEIAVLQSLLDKNSKSGYAKLKIFIRNLNLPPAHPIRKSLWLQLLSTKYSIKLQVSDSNINGNNISATSFMDIDGLSLAGYEFSDQMLLPTFLLNTHGQKCLRTILHNIFIERPQLVYAPQLWPLTALFLHYMPISNACKCILTLLDQPGVLIQTKSDWKEHCLSLEQLAYLCNLLRRDKAKHLISLVFKSNESNVRTVYDANVGRLQLARWCLLIWLLPIEHLVCLVDSFILEGPKVFYRAGLVILKASLSGKYPLSGIQSNFNGSPRDFLYDEEIFKHTPFTPSKLMRKMFSLRVNFDMEKELIHPCNKSGKNTFAAYLLDDNEKPPHPSECISSNELASIITSIEDRKFSYLFKPYLVFSSNVDGNSLRTFYTKAAETENPATILLVRSSSKSSIVGAFCSDRWQPRVESTYYGNGLCFLFRIKPGPFVIYRWIGSGSTDEEITHSIQCQRFQQASNNGIELGGSISNGPPGLSLDSCLTLASSGPTLTFSNPCLITDPADLTQTIRCENGQIGCIFTVGLVELIGFRDL